MEESAEQRLKAALKQLARAEHRLLLFPWNEDYRNAVEVLKQEVASLRASLKPRS